MKDENPNKDFKNRTFTDMFHKRRAEASKLEEDHYNRAKLREFVEYAANKDGLDLDIFDVEDIVSDMYESLVKAGVDIDAVDFKEALEQYG